MDDAAQVRHAAPLAVCLATWLWEQGAYAPRSPVHAGPVPCSRKVQQPRETASTPSGRCKPLVCINDLHGSLVLVPPDGKEKVNGSIASSPEIAAIGSPGRTESKPGTVLKLMCQAAAIL